MKTNSDSQIQNDVTNELKWEPRVCHESVCVTVDSGVVTLCGNVPTYAEKMAAEKAAMRVGGVKGVTDEIEVRLEESNLKNDSEIAEAAVNSLQWNVWTPESLKAEVQQGWVTLSGEVESEFQRKAAVNSVRFITGVTGISNDIKITTKITTKVEPENVKKKIEEAFVRDAKLEAKYVNVLVEGSAVTLTGDVHTYFEKNAAASAVWRAKGVRLLKNNIRVV